jgi:serine protease Do
MQPLDRDLAEYFGIPEETGIIVSGVSAGSPAARAKLRPGDIVTRFDGRSVEAEKEEDLGTFQRWVANRPPGEKVPVEVLRDGRRRSLEVTLASQPRVEPEESETDLGFHVQEITERLYREQRLDSRRGAYVSFVARGSPAAVAGLFPGDVVERIADRDVDDLEEFERAIERVEDRASVLVTARRGGDLKFLLMKRGARPSPPARSDGDAGQAALVGEE